MKEENQKKKILYLITKSNWGGAQRYVYDLATNLPKDKFEAVVLHGGNGLLSQKLDQAGIKRIPVSELDRDVKFLDEIKVFIKIVKIYLAEKPDVVHLNSSKIGGLGALAGRIARVKKIIFTAHGFPFNEDRPTWQRILIWLLSYVTVLFAHKTIVISEKEEKQAKKWFFVKNKIKLIYNGISQTDYFEQQEARDFLLSKADKVLVDKIKNKDNVLWVGTISELTGNKGLKYSIKAIKKLQKMMSKEWNGVFVIIGGGEEKETLEKLIDEKNLKEKVFLAGFIDNASRYLKAFDIFILSSIKEGLPYVLLEAGQAGNSIIATNVGGIGEIVDDMKNGILVRPRDEKELANALRFYSETPRKLKEFEKKIKAKIELKFSLEEMMEETREVYE